VSRPNTTVVVLAGADAADIARALGALPGVTTVDAAGRDRVRDLAASAHSPYLVHGFDPLGAVGDAWVGYFDGTVPAGTLEVATEEALSALRRETEILPDYYLVLDPEAMPVTRRHWWLGALASVAPSRVVPVASSVGAVRETLGRLPAGRWWPAPVEPWLRGLPRVVPDRIGLPEHGQGSGTVS
jgi:hypothetical protein